MRWQDAGKKVQQPDKVRSEPVFTALLIVGVLARFLLPQFGFNHDFTSYGIVSDIVLDGGNVYAETERYNYGPVWFLLIGALRWIGEQTAAPVPVFRVGLVALLTAADFVIALLLRREFGSKIALLFFLNPVSILITGYHNQFDNLAIALAFAAVSMIGRSDPETDRRRWLGGLCLLGLSLTVKHIFFLFPLWLALRTTRWSDRLVAAALPVLLFALSFLPFVAGGANGILHNVFLYRSFNNGLISRLVTDGLGGVLPAAIPFILMLAAFGLLVRKRPPFEAALLYLVALVVLSPAMANQYLAIPMATVVAALNPLYLLYAASAVLIILSNNDGLALHLFEPLGPGASVWLDGRFSYDLPVALLALGLVWQLVAWRRAGSAEDDRPRAIEEDAALGRPADGAS